MTTWQTPGNPLDCASCNCGGVAFALTCYKFCSNGAATLPGLAVTLTQGSTSVTATSDGSGVATFSLPAAGSWTASLPSPPTGYASTTTVYSVPSGGGSASYQARPDIAGGYNCWGPFSCADPAKGPFTLNGTYAFCGGTVPVSASLSTANRHGANFGSGWGLLGSCGGTDYYIFFDSSGPDLTIYTSTYAGGFGTDFIQQASSVGCDGAATYSGAFTGTIS